MELFILRHAEAGYDAATDFDRCLTEKGREQSRRIGKFLKKHDLHPDLVLSSPYVRARETAELVCETAGLGSPVIDETLGCGMSPEDAAELLRAHAENFERVLITGHNPDLQHLAEWFLGMEDAAVHVRKSSLLHLELRGFARGAAILEFFLAVRYVDL